MCPKNGKPQIPCPEGCGATVAVVLVDAGTEQERELLVDVEPAALGLLGPVMVWGELFSGHPPRGIVLPPGSLHRVHTCLRH